MKMLSKGFLIVVTPFLFVIFSLTPLYSTAQTADISAQIRNAIQKKDWNQALLLINQVVKADSSNSKMIAIRAHVYDEQNKYELAAADHKRITRLDSLHDTDLRQLPDSFMNYHYFLIISDRRIASFSSSQ